MWDMGVGCAWTKRWRDFETKRQGYKENHD